MVENFVRWLPIFISFVQIIFLQVERGGAGRVFIFNTPYIPDLLRIYTFLEYQCKCPESY